MKFTHTLTAAKTVEGATWAVADGLVQDYTEAGVRPTPLHFKEASEALQAKGYTYVPGTLQEYWRVASTFAKSRRKASQSVSLYLEFTRPLWARLPEETRANDLVGYAAAFFAQGGQSHREARSYAQSMAADLDAQRKADEEAKQLKAYREALKGAEAHLKEAIEVGIRNVIVTALDNVNDLRRRLGMDLLKIDFDAEETTAKKDEEATEKQQAEDEERKKEDARRDAISLWEKDIALVGIRVRALANTYVRVSDDLTQEDRDAAVDEIDREIAKLQVLRNNLTGAINEAELQAALADWTSE